MRYKKIEQEIEAIQWDGTEGMRDMLKDKYPDHTLVITIDGALRYMWGKSMKQDGRIELADYIILWKHYIEEKRKEIFESHYTIKL